MPGSRWQFSRREYNTELKVWFVPRSKWSLGSFDINCCEVIYLQLWQLSWKNRLHYSLGPWEESRWMELEACALPLPRFSQPYVRPIFLCIKVFMGLRKCGNTYELTWFKQVSKRGLFVGIQDCPIINGHHPR